MVRRMRRPGLFESIAVVVVVGYAAVLLGTFLHLGVHPHIYSPDRNAFVHPEDNSSAEESDSPTHRAGNPRTNTRKADHLLHFYNGYFSGAAVVPAIAPHEEPLEKAPRPAPDVRIVSYALAPKHSPPSA